MIFAVLDPSTLTVCVNCSFFYIYCKYKLEIRGEAQRVVHPAQTRLQNSGITGPKFTKFLPDVEESSTLLMHAFLLRFSDPLWNVSAQNELEEGGVCQSSSIRTKNRLL